jgi:L-2,4-diaminobutyrate transaminase
VAAFIAEPVLGTGGLIPPPPGYFVGVQAILKKYDILLIADEVVTGFGRLGTMFGSDYFNLQPDFMTIAKGLTSAYAPLSGSIISDRVWKVLEAGTDEFGPFGHGSTYSAHPLCAAAGVANLEVLDQQGLIENVNAVGAYFGERLRAAIGGHSHCGEVRSIGMLAAIELAEDPVTRQHFDPRQKIGPSVANEMLKHGVIARSMPHSDIIGFAPPFCLTTSDADLIVDATEKAMHAVLGH